MPGIVPAQSTTPRGGAYVAVSSPGGSGQKRSQTIPVQIRCRPVPAGEGMKSPSRYCRGSVRRGIPSQSAALTAPPEGEPRTQYRHRAGQGKSDTRPSPCELPHCEICLPFPGEARDLTVCLRLWYDRSGICGKYTKAKCVPEESAHILHFLRAVCIIQFVKCPGLVPVIGGKYYERTLCSRAGSHGG